MTPERPMDGYAKTELSSGTMYHVIHYSADEEKDEQWAKDALRGIPSRIRRREYELDENVSEGEPYWQEYVDALHCVKTGRGIPLVPGSSYYGGWDCGTARMPAFALAQLTPRSKQLQWILEVVPQRPMAMETFAPIVRQALKAKLPGKWADVVHVGDATVKTMSGAVERSAFTVAHANGFTIRPISNALDARERAVIYFLTDMIDQDGPQESWKPRMVYEEDGCPTLVAGMRGLYQLTPAPGGDESGPGAQYKLPAKNFYSHINDAHQYVCVHLEKRFRRVTSGDTQRSRHSRSRAKRRR